MYIAVISSGRQRIERGDGNNRLEVSLVKFTAVILLFDDVDNKRQNRCLAAISKRDIIGHGDEWGKEISVEGSKLYVGNLTYSVTNADLEELFSNHGVVRQVDVLEGRGFGFVEMSDNSEAEKAKQALDGTDFRGRTLRVDEARPPRGREDRSY